MAVAYDTEVYTTAGNKIKLHIAERENKEDGAVVTFEWPDGRTAEREFHSFEEFETWWESVTHAGHA